MLINPLWSENNACYVVVLSPEIWKTRNGLHGFCFRNHFLIYDQAISGNATEVKDLASLLF